MYLEQVACDKQDVPNLETTAVVSKYQINQHLGQSNSVLTDTQY